MNLLSDPCYVIWKVTHVNTHVVANFSSSTFSQTRISISMTPSGPTSTSWLAVWSFSSESCLTRSFQWEPSGHSLRLQVRRRMCKCVHSISTTVWSTRIWFSSHSLPSAFLHHSPLPLSFLSAPLPFSPPSSLPLSLSPLPLFLLFLLFFPRTGYSCSEGSSHCCTCKGASCSQLPHPEDTCSSFQKVSVVRVYQKLSFEVHPKWICHRCRLFCVAIFLWSSI